MAISWFIATVGVNAAVFAPYAPYWLNRPLHLHPLA
jgi:hypothetical protein